MNEFANAFWREFQYRIINLIQNLANQYPVIAWFILYIFGLFILYFSLKYIYYFFTMYKKSKNIKTLKIGIIFLLPIVIVFYFLIKFTIYKSDGYLIYLCIFSWISTFCVIFWALRPEKFIPNKPQRKKPKKSKNEKVKFKEPKEKLNLKNIKFKNHKGNSDE